MTSLATLILISAVALTVAGALAYSWKRRKSSLPSGETMGSAECSEIHQLLRQVELPTGWSAKLLSLIADKRKFKLLRIVISDTAGPRMQIDCRRTRGSYVASAHLPGGLAVKTATGADLTALLCAIADSSEFDAFLYGKQLPGA